MDSISISVYLDSTAPAASFFLCITPLKYMCDVRFPNDIRIASSFDYPNIQRNFPAAYDI